MICMSPSSTVGIITKLSKQFDQRVLNWASEVKKVCLFLCTLIVKCFFIDHAEVDTNGTNATL